jgi:tRNA/tmRNA/rRNA uracil-C5-methylase (TrmA/RlmC/RlmD family)
VSRRTRERKSRGRSHVGERFEVEVGPIAHGGHCVARHEERVVFVRHALPGERVVVSVTEGEDDDRFWRGDAVSVLTPSPDRVPAPCPYAGPGLCGGCDFQHATPVAQRALKADVVREQLSRLAGIDLEVSVEEVPPLLRWRSRMRYVALPDGARGLHLHR